MTPEQAQAEREKYSLCASVPGAESPRHEPSVLPSSAIAEAKPETVQARKTLWKAEQARKLGRQGQCRPTVISMG